MDISSVDELLTTTRAVRKRLDLTRPVDRDVILECVRLAMQAPTASNAQDWRWLVITDADKRAAIAEIYRSIGANIWPRRRERSDPQTQRVYRSALSLTETLAKVPVHVIPCLEGRFDGTTSWPPRRPGRRSSRPAGASCLRFGPAVWDRCGRRCIWPRSAKWPSCWESPPP